MGFVHFFRDEAAIGLPSRKEVGVKKLQVDCDVGRRVRSCLASGRGGFRHRR